MAKINTIKEYDVANGPGVRMSVWFQGCPHKCIGCFNEETWDKDGNTYLNLKGRKFYAYLTKKGIDYTKLVSRILLPDECVYSEKTNTLYVFEKKFQQTAGSADEKLQTCDFKKKQYQKMTKSLNMKVEYTYILSDWFKQEMYADVLDYIKEMQCDYRFVDNFYTFNLL